MAAERVSAEGADRLNAGITWLEEPLAGADGGPLAGGTLFV